MEKKKNESIDFLSQAKRRWQITINNTENYTSLEDVVNECCAIAVVKYACGCVEIAPTTGHKHIHVYVDFVNAVKGKTICKEFCGAHIEVCKGSQEDNVKYCQKQGTDFYEIGELREPKQDINDIASQVLNVFVNEGMSPIECALNYPCTADYIVKHFNSLQTIYNAIGHKKTNGKIKM